MEFRMCKRCFKYKHLSKFRKNRGIIRLDCKTCENIGRGERRNKVREFYVKYKNGLRCRECGESRFACLNFHHRSPNEKELNIATAVGAYGIKTIMNEIAKCDVLCTNCHTKLHHDLRKKEIIKLERGIVMYSSEEIAGFKAKDLRISKLAITKSLIEKLPLEDIYDVEKVTELVEKYINYVYAERSTKRGDADCVISSTGQDSWEAAGQNVWEELAQGLNLAIPNATNVKILNQILGEYKQAHKASANPKDVLICCIGKFGVYPTKSSSAEKVVKQLLETEK